MLWEKVEDKGLPFAKAFLASEREEIPQRNTGLANLGNHAVLCKRGFVHALSRMNNTHMRACKHTQNRESSCLQG